jgi:riboflavin kinase/FMN adenylyltransferase
MKHVHALEAVLLHDPWLTIGVFDGVHRGHQEIIHRLTEGARAAGAPAVALTFWPHPATVLGGASMRVLTTPDERAALLGALGVDVVITYPFDQAVANTSARDFVVRLKDHLGFRRLLIGYDFALGKGREGNASRLAELGHELGYELEVVPAVGDESGVISSTEIRKLVATGEVGEAAKLLGHSYGVRGRVVHGDSRGRGLGFPTANIEYPTAKILPANGVYACWGVLGSDRRAAAVNVGVRPQFHEQAAVPSVEAYLLDFDGDLYGQELALEFVARLRDESRFSSVPALVDQMHRDVASTRQLLLPA